MTPERAAACVKIARGIRAECVIEISGGITMDNARAYAEAGADFLSSGMLTHSAPAANLSLLVDSIEKRKLRRRRGVRDPDDSRILTGHHRPAAGGLLTLLAENATIVISGARIAKEVGVSRVNGVAMVERLRELGVKVKSHAGTGYFLDKSPIFWLRTC